MIDGFVRVAAATPAIKVADCLYNADQIRHLMLEAQRQKVSVLVTPELSLTGYTCSDLFLSRTLQQGALAALESLIASSKALDVLTLVGMPLAIGSMLYNVAAVIQGGRLLGLIPKSNIPNYAEFYEARHFSPGPALSTITLFGESVPFGTNLLFACAQNPDFVVAAEICEDLWVLESPSLHHARAGATVIANLSASDELIGKADYRRLLVQSHSGRLISAYVYADAGEGESTTDLVFSGHNLIYENSRRLAESPLFSLGLTTADVDVQLLNAERRRQNTFLAGKTGAAVYQTIEFSIRTQALDLRRSVAAHPFVPQSQHDLAERCEEILTLQVQGLKKRLAHTKTRSAIIGLSGGLDSTLALIVTARAFDLLELPRAGIIAVTMPGFGTTDRTYSNALQLAKSLETTLREIPIRAAVIQHFADIGHPDDLHDVTYENSQARERTQILMDIANQTSGLVIGTGDLSELALGWATYNGDHMSMYAVNSSVPKTLVRHLVRHAAGQAQGVADISLNQVLLDILDTPVSPELLPPKDGQIAQQTEQIVGPYELHDFYLYYLVRFGFSPKKILRLARLAFAGQYDETTLHNWLVIFVRRFFSQQFKRSCLPDGPKVGSVTLSPRGDWRMPSDAEATLWLAELT
ncbi:MAG: NAD(+) synthase [Eubacteriales bacterium]|nr:NAD(+) synthase [Eubacteriales bacterium]